jgi:Tfp pilus assembly protein PilF
MRDSGLAHLRTSLELSQRRPIDVAHLARVHALAGQRDSARALVDELERRAKTEYVPAFALAIAYVGQGDTDRAFSQLTKAIENHEPSMSENWFDPVFESLHADPRWLALLDRMGVPHSGSR